MLTTMYHDHDSSIVIGFVHTISFSALIITKHS